jgi:translation elongation factor EF-Ts
VGDIVKAASAKTGEKVELRRIARFASEGTAGSYLHFNGKAGVIVEVAGGKGEQARSSASTSPSTSRPACRSWPSPWTRMA